MEILRMNEKESAKTLLHNGKTSFLAHHWSLCLIKRKLSFNCQWAFWFAFGFRTCNWSWALKRNGCCVAQAVLISDTEQPQGLVEAQFQCFIGRETFSSGHFRGLPVWLKMNQNLVWANSRFYISVPRG